MGPLAGVGDAFFWSTVYPILASIGSNIALAGSIIGPIFLFFTWNIINQGSKWLFLKTGYEKGLEVVTGGQGKSIIEYITKFASIVGMFVVGNLICSTVNINVLTTFTTGELVLSVQNILDSIPLQRKDLHSQASFVPRGVTL